MNASLNEKLRTVKWGEFRLGELFEVLSYQKRFDANKVLIVNSGGHPYIVRQSTDNGKKGNIDEDPKFLNIGNSISFGQDTATMFYQEEPYFTGDKIKILKPRYTEFNKKNAQFFLSSMQKAFSSFSWGNSRFDVETIKNQLINLPEKNGLIDFDFMESFIAELEAERIAELEAERIAELTAYLKVSGLDNCELSSEEEYTIISYKDRYNTSWGKYTIGSLFEKVSTKKLPYKAKDLPKIPVDDYVLPCLTSSFQNQGLNYFVPKKGATVLRNLISIPSNSDVYRAYYQSREFTVLSDAYAIRWKSEEEQLTPKQYLFFVMCINKITDLPIYSYKNKLGGWNVVKDIEICLPEKNGEIDFAYMELLISAVQKLAIKDVVKYADNRISATKECIQ